MNHRKNELGRSKDFLLGEFAGAKNSFSREKYFTNFKNSTLVNISSINAIIFKIKFTTIKIETKIVLVENYWKYIQTISHL